MNIEHPIMEFTGERFVPEVTGDVALEHLHRYFLAQNFVKDKTVLDIASGEGYGSAILAKSASKVFGVDISSDAIEYARQRYSAENLDFIVGNCTDIPLPDACVDVVVSFETIEHHDRHDEMMGEIKRVLKPSGLLIISSPDKYNYSVVPNFRNQFHIKELYKNEFETLLQRYFSNVEIYGQKIQYGSLIAALNPRSSSFTTYQENAAGVSCTFGPMKPPYLIAMASNYSLEAVSNSIYVAKIPPYYAEIERSQVEVSTLRQQYEFLLRSVKEILPAPLFPFSSDTEIVAQLKKNFFELSNTSGELSTANSELTEEIESIKAALENSMYQISKLTVELSSEKSEFSAYQEKTRQLSKQLDAACHAINEIRSSHSWRLTAVFRATANVLRLGKRQLLYSLRRVYYLVPLRPNQKIVFKNIIFTYFGFAFASSAAYKQWRAYRDLGALLPVTKPVRGINQRIVTSLPIADGAIEWSDYAVVKNNILLAKRSLRETVKTSPAVIIDIKDEHLVEEAKKLKFSLYENPEVSILIPVFNEIKTTIECLASIYAHTQQHISYEIIVADDASTDQTAEILAYIGNIRVVRNANNLGFLRNCNEASKFARGKYLLFLNNDVQVTPDWLSSLLETFSLENNVGAVGPKIIYPNGLLQEAGVRWRRNGTAEMIGLFESPLERRFNYSRDVDYCSGACLMVPTQLFNDIGRFDDRFAPAYCEDSDLCLKIRKQGLRIIYSPKSIVIHHLSKTSDNLDRQFKLRCIATNLEKLTRKWQADLDRYDDVRIMAFYLPQFHPIPENDLWWGKGFTEWRNVTKAQPNFEGHYQPRLPADLGFYDLRLGEVLREQSRLAKRYGIDGFCIYYYWFAGHRLLEKPVDMLLQQENADIPFFFCWANENWTRRWDGNDSEILIGQSHSEADDLEVIHDLIRYFRSSNYVRINGKPLILIYRVTLFPDFCRTAEIWRQACRESGIGEIYIALVESFELVHRGVHPSVYGCDAAVEFPPQELAQICAPSGPILNNDFRGSVGDYRDLAVRFATRDYPAYTRFPGVAPGWDNTARKQNNSFCFEHSSPGAFQAWLESAISTVKQQCCGDERLVFINAWNEWAEGAYLEPDRCYGHTYLEAVKNARDVESLMKAKNLDAE